MGLTADLIDLDAAVPDEDLKLARQALGHGRSEGESFSNGRSGRGGQ